MAPKKRVVPKKKEVCKCFWEGIPGAACVHRGVVVIPGVLTPRPVPVPEDQFMPHITWELNHSQRKLWTERRPCSGPAEMPTYQEMTANLSRPGYRCTHGYEDVPGRGQVYDGRCMWCRSTSTLLAFLVDRRKRESMMGRVES
jgi:hypothetical protein